MANNFAISREFINQICEAVGVDPENTSKIIVEASADNPLVMVYIQALGDERLLRVDWAENAEELKVVVPASAISFLNEKPTVVVDGDPIPLEHLSLTALHYLYAGAGLLCPFCENGTIDREGDCTHCSTNVFRWYKLKTSTMPSDERKDITLPPPQNNAK